MHAAKSCFSARNHFTVTSFVDLATAVSADVETWLNSNGDEFSEPFEKSRAQFSAFLGEFEDLFFFLAHGLDGVFHQPLLFQLLKKWVDEAWTYFFFYSFFEASEYLVAVGGSFVEYGEYVEA